MTESLSKARRRPSVEKTTNVLLACRLMAGPLFVGVAVGQVLLRDGFDLTRHPLSLLSLGELGWIQVTNFAGSRVRLDDRARCSTSGGNGSVDRPGG
jgi:Protein of unknown function (DUF998)